MASLRELDPAFKQDAQDLLDLAQEMDPSFVVTSGLRTWQQQQRLYSRYLSGESPLPAAPPGRSQHELGLAIDIARLNVDPREDDLLEEIGRAWESVGGVWGGDIGDPVHFEAGPSMKRQATRYDPAPDLAARKSEMTSVLRWTPLGSAIDWVRGLF